MKDLYSISYWEGTVKVEALTWGEAKTYIYNLELRGVYDWVLKHYNL